MSELISTLAGPKDSRWKLLSTASAISVLAAATGSLAATQDVDRPTVWVELGGQLERIAGNVDPYAAPFTIANFDKPVNVLSPLNPQFASHSGFGDEGRILFEPQGSDWVFSAAVRYGRSSAKKSLHQQTSTKKVFKTAFYGYNGKYGHFTQTTYRFNDDQVKYGESHAVIDFMVGKDVGLGLFSSGGRSVLNFGIRFAQFHSRSDITLKSFPDPHGPASGLATVANTQWHHHSYFATAKFSRSFRGVGPSLAWTGSSHVAGSPSVGELTFDWGANAAILFGRQKVQGYHEARATYVKGITETHYVHMVPVIRSQPAISPNLGGLVGLSVVYPSAKVSFGYRADFFFGAMDGGIDTRKAYNQSFYGPYAMVSIGLGG